jgi:hypothetical protein
MLRPQVFGCNEFDTSSCSEELYHVSGLHLQVFWLHEEVVAPLDATSLHLGFAPGMGSQMKVNGFYPGHRRGLLYVALLPIHRGLKIKQQIEFATIRVITYMSLFLILLMERINTAMIAG